MDIVRIIQKKRDGGALSAEEIAFFVRGVTDGGIADYQATALLMAIWFRGMNASETAALTQAMADSGARLSHEGIAEPTCDKHSTGGVGDKTSLIVLPIVASCGVRVPKLSGRGLGHTGGTLDKLAAIPGLRTDLSADRIRSTVLSCGFCIAAGTAELAPADKILYALRDVTATVDSIPLIAASIMSKKMAAGSRNILLDVKAGSGAFMKKRSDARALAKQMADIGKLNGLRVSALITNMDAPLGYAIGNTLEVIEAVQTLQGVGPADLTELCIALSAEMLRLCGMGSAEECEEKAKHALYSGLAFERLMWMVSAQGGDTGVLTDTSLLRKSRCYHTVSARAEGYISHIDARKCGLSAMALGAGRKVKTDVIDPSAGVILDVKPGDRVQSGDRIATLCAEKEELFSDAVALLADAFEISTAPPKPVPMVLERIANY